MASFKELNDYAKQILGTDFQRATLTRWVKNGTVKAIKNNNGRFDYDLESFKIAINSEDYLKKSKAVKQNPKDFIGKTCGQLLITGIVPRNEYKENYIGTLMYCDCLNCGKKHIQVRFSYLSGNGNYTQETCGCNRKIRAFQSTTRQDLTDEYLNSFDDFEKFLLIHKCLSHTIKIDILNIPLQNYKNMIQYFYNDNQFNKIYKFWKENTYFKGDTFYDWAKPSIDHIIPKSKGGTDEIDNLQFLTVFENLAKRDMTQVEWEKFKKQTHTTSDYFIESIMKGGKDSNAEI